MFKYGFDRLTVGSVDIIYLYVVWALLSCYNFNLRAYNYSGHFLSKIIYISLHVPETIQLDRKINIVSRELLKTYTPHKAY